MKVSALYTFCMMFHKRLISTSIPTEHSIAYSATLHRYVSIDLQIRSVSIHNGWEVALLLSLPQYALLSSTMYDPLPGTRTCEGDGAGAVSANRLALSALRACSAGRSALTAALPAMLPLRGAREKDICGCTAAVDCDDCEGRLRPSVRRGAESFEPCTGIKADQEM